MEEKIDYFKHKSKTYSKDSKRVQNVQTIAKGILKKINYAKHMHIMDFGSGTGLLSIEIAPYVQKITAVDNSPSMNETLQEHSDLVKCELDIIEANLEVATIEQQFDGIISSMTLHHVKDIENIFQKFYDLLQENGTLAIADLYSEDGSFHSENTGVHHYGFEEEFLIKCAKAVGFKDIKCEEVSVAKKPHREFSIFLFTARK
jgi:cyclopropane fatty-acyl-phospholipid synthase-like methyltransferase